MKALFFENKIAKVVLLKAASFFDKFAALGPLSPLKYEEVPEPQLPNPRWLKVKNIACGLCGTDVHFMFMEMDPKVFHAAMPGIERKYLGHELLAEVVEVGTEVDGFAVGDRVALRVDWPSCRQMEIDPPCRQCAEGNYLLCENYGAKPYPTINTGGGFSPYMIMHQSQPFRIPEALSNDRALLIEPTACGIHGVLRRKPKPGENVLVIGAGTIGLLTIAAAKWIEPEAKVTALARYPFQAELATALGADNIINDGKELYRRIADATGARYIKGHFGNEILLGGYDVIYDSVGSDGSIHNALRFARARGDVVILGINYTPGKIDYSPIWGQEVTLHGMNSHAFEQDGRGSFEMAAQLLAEVDAPFEKLLTHRFKMDDFRDAVRLFKSKSNAGAVKIVLEHR